MESLGFLTDLFDAKGVYVFAIVTTTLVLRFVAKFVFDRLAKQLERTHNLYDDAVLDAARKPIGWAIWAFGILFAAEVAGQDSESELFDYIDPIRDVAAIVLLAWFAVRFIRFVEGHIAEYDRTAMDKATLAALSKLLRASVLITGLLMALQSVGVPITGVLAFGGVGGLAVGFAARDLLANFFGALMIFLDRPFAEGDWVRSADREIEGTVEQIGWRMTSIRTFDQRPLYVPNSVFSTLTVENPSRMRNRRIYEIVGVRYDDVGVVRDIVDDIRRMLMDHPEMETEGRTLIVNLLSFGPSSLDIMIYTFTKTTDWVKFHGIKEDVMLKVADIVAGRGADFAFPTQTVHVEMPPLAEPDPR